MEFEQDTGTTPENTPAPTNDPLAELVGEGKPYKDHAALAKSKLEGDEFIGQLKSENFEMRKAVKEMEEKLARAGTTADILEAVRSMSPPVKDTADPAVEAEPGNQPAFTEENIEALIQRTLSKSEQEKLSETNYKMVKDSFMKSFKDPDKARVQYKAAAVSLEMTEAQLDVYSKQNPHLVLRAAGLEPAVKSTSTPPSYLQSNQNPEAAPRNENVRDHTWWEAQRKANGNTWYFSTKTQQKYWQDATALGDSFLPQEG